MSCTYHPGAILTKVIQQVPFCSIYGLHSRERVIFRCSIERCPFVAVEPDTERVDKRYCRICGERILDNYSLTDCRCNHCKSKYQKSLDKAKSSKHT